jgi:ribosome-binding factor A
MFNFFHPYSLIFFKNIEFKRYFCKMETNRQKKIAGVLQKDLVDVLQSAAREGMKGVIISVTKVNVTSDLSEAKIYVSVFPSDKRDELLKGIVANTIMIRHELAQRTRHQLRRMPNLLFFPDDSLDYIENIDNALKGNEENPIDNPDILDQRQKR